MSVEIQTHENDIGKKIVIKSPSGEYRASIILHNSTFFLFDSAQKRKIGEAVEDLINQLIAQDVADCGQI